MQVGVEFREVPLLFFKLFMSDELGIFSRPKPRAADMVCMTVTQHYFDGLKITESRFKLTDLLAGLNHKSSIKDDVAFSGRYDEGITDA